ncbi:MAG: hypothetical protein ACXW4K_11105 [Candidatus Deferrimicrobiaceae bacterium]
MGRKGMPDRHIGLAPAYCPSINEGMLVLKFFFEGYPDESGIRKKA